MAIPKSTLIYLWTIWPTPITPNFTINNVLPQFLTKESFSTHYQDRLRFLESTTQTRSWFKPGFKITNPRNLSQPSHSPKLTMRRLTPMHQELRPRLFFITQLILWYRQIRNVLRPIVYYHKLLPAVWTFAMMKSFRISSIKRIWVNIGRWQDHISSSYSTGSEHTLSASYSMAT